MQLAFPPLSSFSSVKFLTSSQLMNQRLIKLFSEVFTVQHFFMA